MPAATYIFAFFAFFFFFAMMITLVGCGFRVLNRQRSNAKKALRTVCPSAP
jgi:hypothetical protein